MSNSDNNSFSKTLRAGEKEVVKKLVKWKLRREGLPPPNEERLEQGAEKVVDQAHHTLKKTGSNLLEGLKQAHQEFLKSYRGENKK